MAPADGTLAGAAEAGLRKRRRGAFGPLRGPAAGHTLISVEGTGFGHNGIPF